MYDVEKQFMCEPCEKTYDAFLSNVISMREKSSSKCRWNNQPVKKKQKHQVQSVVKIDYYIYYYYYIDLKVFLKNQRGKTRREGKAGNSSDLLHSYIKEEHLLFV